MIKKFFIFIVFLVNFQAKAQFLEDKESTSSVLKGLDFLYNQQFSKAEAEFAPVKEKYKDHPVRFLLNALVYQWKNIPIDQHPNALEHYKTELNKCVDSGLKYYEKPAYKMESTFFLLASHGFLALTENYKGNSLNAAQEARKALKYFKESKKYTNENAEFLFAIGLYNYYRERYPETKPIVKPIMVFFDAGNMALGLNQLEKSYKNSLFSRTEAATYLTNIYIKYESNFGKAQTFSSALHKKYPNNIIFKIAHIEALLLNMKFDEAEALTQTLKNNTNSVAALPYHMFNGYIEEHKNKNFADAEAAYQKAIQLKYNDRYTKEYMAFAYLGLARISKTKGDKTNAKNYYKQCLKFAEYTWIIQAAKTELKTVS